GTSPRGSPGAFAARIRSPLWLLIPARPGSGGCHVTRPRRQVPAVRGERVPAVQCITSPFTWGSSAPRVPRETRVTRVPNVCRLQSLEWDVHRVREGMARRARGKEDFCLAAGTPARNRPDGRRTAGPGPAGQAPADRGPDDRDPATGGPAGNEPPGAPRTGPAEQTPAPKAPAA